MLHYHHGEARVGQGEQFAHIGAPEEVAVAKDRPVGPAQERSTRKRVSANSVDIGAADKVSHSRPSRCSSRRWYSPSARRCGSRTGSIVEQPAARAQRTHADLIGGGLGESKPMTTG